MEIKRKKSDPLLDSVQDGIRERLRLKQALRELKLEHEQLQFEQFKLIKRNLLYHLFFWWCEELDEQDEADERQR